MITTPQFLITLLFVILFDAKQKDCISSPLSKSLAFHSSDSLPDRKIICNFSFVEENEIPSCISSLPQSYSLYQRYLDTVQKYFRMDYSVTHLCIDDHRGIAWCHVYSESKRSIGLNINAIRKESQQSERQIIYCLLAHEFFHLREYGDPYSVAAKLISEILADMASGEIAAIHLNEGMEFFHEEMIGLYNLSPKSSSTHPDAKFRINAAKAGWLKAKFTDIKTNENYKIVDFKDVRLLRFRKDNGEKSYWEYGILNRDGKRVEDVVLREYDNGDLCIGYYRDNDLTGNAIILFKNEDRRDYRGIYLGEWRNNMRNGVGTTYYVDDNQIIRGWWSNNSLIKKF